jgi:guanosine-3',5'-bis(diphosphate) 3'-pyrophosphohydrolase
MSIEPTVSDMAASARKFAVKAHGEQMYGSHPYVFHLDQVLTHLSSYGEFAQVVGYLHDVIEDTVITREDIERQFGFLAADCVSLLTDEPGANRKERKVKTYKKMSFATGPVEIALVVKVADRLANVKACIASEKDDLLEMYQQEHPVFQASVYRVGQCEELWEELDRLLGATS